jgi:hypothetical protein
VVTVAARAIVVVLVTALPAASCGSGAHPNAGDAGRPSALSSQHKRLAAAATEALAHPGGTGVYAGRTDDGRRALLRISAERRVRFSIVAACRSHPLRAFPDRPPLLGRDGSFRYRERGRAYRLSVSGRVLGQTAGGSLALSGRPRNGPPCQVRAGWRATRR